MPKVIHQHNFIIFQAWTDFIVNFPYLVRAPLGDHNLQLKTSHAYISLASISSVIEKILPFDCLIVSELFRPQP